MSWENREYHREDGDRSQSSFSIPKPTMLATILMSVCTVVYILQRVTPLGPYIAYWGKFTFDDGLWWKQPWRLVTSQYLHGDFGHLIWNMLSIYFILPILEQYWGPLRTFFFYTAAGVAACLSLALFTPFIGWGHGLIGASGAVLGVLGAIAYLAPKMDIAFMMIVPMSMRAIAILYAVIYSLTVLTDQNSSDAAHLGGLAFGVAAPWIYDRLNLRTRFQDSADTRQRRQRQRTVDAEIDEQKAVDQILEKVGRSGMQSLTGREKKTLQRASDSQRKRDQDRARRYGKV